MVLKIFFRDFFDFLYPRICYLCENELLASEECICICCHLDLARSHFNKHPENPVFRGLAIRMPLLRAAPYLHFSKGSIVQTLLHQIKYRGGKAMAFYMGQLAGQEWIQSGFFTDLDYLIPVPLHPKKLKKRGYNQAAEIARGLSEALAIPLKETILIRELDQSSQTKENRYHRWERIAHSFGLRNSDVLKNKRVMLIDDVITTGATIEACASPLLKIEGLELSVFSLAYA